MTLLRYLGDTTCEIIEISSDKKSYVYLKFHNEKIERIRLYARNFDHEVEYFYTVKKYYNVVAPRKIEKLKDKWGLKKIKSML